MERKEELINEIEKIIKGVRNPPALMHFMPNMPYSRRRFGEIIDKCIDLQKELASKDESLELFDLQKKFYSIEAEYKNLRGYLMLMPSVMVLYIGIFLIYAAIRWIEIPKFIKETLGVEAPEKLITFGIAGAFVYLATFLLTKLETITEGDTQFVAIANFTIRLSLAIVVPIILVALFFTNEGEFGEVKISPELLSFACGYSAKLVVDFFNKIIEKCTKMIETI